jgi:hypothetical protein
MHRGIKLCENFLYAGNSALLLAIAHLYPDYWFFALFAFVPFFWQSMRVSCSGAIILGILFATSYTFVYYPVDIPVKFTGFLGNLILLNAAFAAFALIVNRTGRKFGFNPIIIAAFWLLLEFSVLQSDGMPGISLLPKTDSPLVFRFSVLFGALMVSFAVILINAIILVLIKYIGAIPVSKRRLSFECKSYIINTRRIGISDKFLYRLPDCRAPPQINI